MHLGFKKVIEVRSDVDKRYIQSGPRYIGIVWRIDGDSTKPPSSSLLSISPSHPPNPIFPPYATILIANQPTRLPFCLLLECQIKCTTLNMCVFCSCKQLVLTVALCYFCSITMSQDTLNSVAAHCWLCIHIINNNTHFTLKSRYYWKMFKCSVQITPIQWKAILVRTLSGQKIWAECLC